MSRAAVTKTDPLPAPDPGTAPLAGIRVLEFSHMVMGPACGVVLADLGAEVIKVEPMPDGDRTRRLPGSGAGFFPLFNRNKKSLAIDLKDPEAKELVLRLADTADVVFDNFGPGTIERLGFGWSELSGRNPRLIHCSLKGFLSGPYEHRTALDEVVQMMGGLAYMTGPPGQPLRAGASVIDIVGGMFGAIAILAALEERNLQLRPGASRVTSTREFRTNPALPGRPANIAPICRHRQPGAAMPGNRLAAVAVYTCSTPRGTGARSSVGHRHRQPSGAGSARAGRAADWGPRITGLATKTATGWRPPIRNHAGA